MVRERYARPKFHMVPLGSLTTLVQYGTSERAIGEPIGVPVLRIPNLQAEGWDLSDLKYLQLPPEGLATYRLEKGDILFNRTNGSRELVGKCEVFNFDGDWAFASYLIRLRIDREQAVPEFVAAFLNTYWGRKQIEHVSRQILMSNINTEEIRALRVPLPKRPKQKELLATLNAARAQRKKKLGDADALIAGLDGFVLDQLGLTVPPSHDPGYAFAVRLGTVRGRTDVHYNRPHFRRLAAMIRDRHGVHLREVASAIFSGATPLSGGDAYTPGNDGVPFIRSGEITTDGRVSDRQELHLRSEIHDGPMKRSQLSKGDVLIAIVGATIGAVGVYDRDGPANINQAIAAVRLRESTLIPDYLVAFLKSSAGQAVLQMVSRPVARANINLDEVGELFVPVPDDKVQIEVAAEVARCRDEARRLRTQADALWDQAKAAFEAALLGPETHRGRA